MDKDLKMASSSLEDTRQQPPAARMTVDEFSMLPEASTGGKSFVASDCAGNSGHVPVRRPMSKQTSDLAAKEEDQLITGMGFSYTDKNLAVSMQSFKVTSTNIKTVARLI